MTSATDRAVPRPLSSRGNRIGGVGMEPSPAQEGALDRKLRMRIPFQAQRARPVEQRLQDFDETFLPLTAEEAIQAAERCIHCPEPAACPEACPVTNGIPAAMWLIDKR